MPFRNSNTAMTVRGSFACGTSASSPSGTGSNRTTAGTSASTRLPSRVTSGSPAISQPSHVNPRGLRILQALDVVARELNAKPGQIAIAWLLHQSAVTSPIASATSLSQLAELVSASELHLSNEQLALLGSASQE